MKNRVKEYYQLREELKHPPEKLAGAYGRALTRLSEENAAMLKRDKHISALSGGKKQRNTFRWAAAAAAVVVFAALPLCHPSVRAYAGEFFDRIAANFGGDFYEPVSDCSVTASGVTLSVNEVWVEQDEARISYSLDFPEDCSALAQSANFFEDRGGGIFYHSELFDESKITVKSKGDIIWSNEVADCALTDRRLSQQLVLLLENSYTGTLDISFELANLRVGDKLYEGPWELEYSLDCGKYGGSAAVTPIELATNRADSFGTMTTLTGYSYNATGLKVYADYSGNDISNAVLRCTDDLGNVYFYYYGSTNPGDYADVCYTIYRKDNFTGLEYVTHHDFGAKTMTFELGELLTSERRTVDYYGNSLSAEDFVPLSDALTIELKLSEITPGESGGDDYSGAEDTYTIIEHGEYISD